MNKFYIMVFFIFFSSFKLSAVASSISFDEALSQAMKNNKELKIKKLAMKNANLSINEANSYNFGKLEFNENITNTNHAGYVFGMALASREASFLNFGFDEFLALSGAGADGDTILSTQPQNLNNPKSRTNYETKLVYELPIFTGFKLQNGKQMAQLQAKATKAQYTYDKKQLGLEVLKAYNGSVASYKIIQMIKKAQKTAQKFVKTSKSLYKKNLVRLIDINQAKMAQLSLKTKLHEAQTQFSLAISYLQFLTNNDKITSVDGFTKIKSSNQNLKKLQKNAVEKRDDLKSLNLNAKTMKKKIDFDSSEKYPTIGAHIEYGANDDEPTLSSAKDYYLAAIGLSYTIFNGGLTSTIQQKAQIQYLKMQKYLELKKDGIALDVKKNYLNFKTLISTLDDKIKVSKMANDILKQTNNIYKNNLKFRTNMMYLLMSLQSQIKSKADEIMSHYDTTIALGKLNLSIGNTINNKDIK